MKLDTKAIRARADAATAGPWCDWTCKLNHEHGRARRCNADSAFVAAARSDVPALCDRVDALEAALRRIATGDYPTDPHGAAHIAQRALEGT